MLRNRPEIRKNSGIRNGVAKAITQWKRPTPPASCPTLKTEYIITTRMMEMPLAESTQLRRSLEPDMPHAPGLVCDLLTRAACLTAGFPALRLSRVLNR